MVIRYPQDQPRLFQAFGYPGGERQVRLTTVGREAILLQREIKVIARLTGSESLVDLMMLSNALHHTTGTRRTELILPYFPYARADRRFVTGDCFGLRVFLGMIDSLGYDRVTTLDVHSDKTAKYTTSLFEDVNPLPFVRRAEAYGMRDTVLLAPDEGAVARYGLKGLHCTKERDPRTGKLLGFTVPKKSAFRKCKRILIYDDICDGGGTFVGIGKALLEAGIDAQVDLYVTHGIFSKGFGELDNYIHAYFCTNSFRPVLNRNVLQYDCEPLLLGEKQK